MAYSESIFARQKCFKQVFQGKATNLLATSNYSPKEVLLDILVTFYDNLKVNNEKHDKFVSGFLEKFEPFVAHIKNLRVTIDDFDIERVIGCGHFGLVKLVREKSSGDVYAMKILKKDDILASQDLNFYEEERNIMAQAASSWITRLHYAFQDSQHLCLVMDYHPGGDLLGLLDKWDRVLGEDMTRFYMAELTLAIDSLHKMGFAHRDIKPENILFDRFGHLKLADFGSAACINQDGSITSSMPVGTLNYIAPEVLQCIEKSNGVDQSQGYHASCDYWSLGIVGYEMVYGYTPFDSETNVGRTSKIMNHKENLYFPEDDAVSGHFKKLLKGLLCDANVRYGRKDVETHPFFISIQWDNIQNMTPEYIPVVSSRDDTSNFEHFDDEPRSTSIGGRINKKNSKDSLEKNLPFIGFTFTRNEGSLNVPSPSKLQENVKPRRKTMVEVNVQVESGSTEKTLNRSAIDYASRISAEVKKSRQKDEEIKKLREKNLLLEKERRDTSVKMQIIESRLKREQLDRAANDSLTLEKIRNLKEDLSRIHSEKVNETFERCEFYKEQCRILEEKKLKAEEDLFAFQKKLENEKLQHEKLQKKYEDDIRRYKTSRRSILDTSIASEITPSVIEFRSHELKSKLETAEDELNNQRTENGILMKKIEELTAELEFVIAEKESLVQDIGSELSDKDAQHQALEILGEENKELKLRVKDLESQKQSVTEKYVTCSSQCHKLKVEVEILQRSMNDVSSTISSQKSSEIEEKLKGKIDDLSDQLLRSVEESKTLKIKVKALEKEIQLKSEQILIRKEPKPEAEEKLNTELSKLRNDIEKLSTELSAAKLELMSREKKLELSKETHHFLREEKRRVVQEATEKKKEINSLVTKIAELQSNVQRLEDTIKEKDITTKIIEETKCKENERLQALLEAEKKKMEAVKDLKNDLTKVKDELRIANRQKSMLNEEVALANDKVKSAVNNNRAAQEEISRLTKEVETIKKHKENLRVAAMELNAENEDQYKTISSLKEEIKELLDRSSLHTEDTNKLKEELRKARVSVNEEKSLRIFHETKIKELENSLISMEKDSKAEITCLKTSNEELRHTVGRLSSENDQLKMTLLERSNDIEDLNQDLDTNLKDTVRIKEEMSRVYTKLNALQEQHSEFEKSLEVAIRKGEDYKEKCSELETDMQNQIQFYKEREARDEAIMGQHVKLIDYLKSQLEQPKKKSGLIDKLFGSKDVPKNHYAPIANKETECLLKKSDQRIKELEAQVNKLRSQLNLGNEGGVSKRHTDSECNRKKSEKGGSLKNLGKDSISSPKSASRVPIIVTQPPPKPQRVGTDVPHKFEQRMNTGAVRCQLCRKTVPIGEYVNSCKECKFSAHTQCAVKVPANCDLHSLMAEKSSNASDVLASDSSIQTGTAGNVEGWIKVPKLGRSRWEVKYLRFEGQKLCMYDQEPCEGLKPVTCLDLSSESHSIYVVPAVELAEVSYCAESDLPFVFKIETKSLTSCFPSHTLYFLTSSHEEKKRWITGFQYACNLHRVSSASLEDRNIPLSNHCRTLMTFNSNKIEVHCAVNIGEATVIGTSLGLYALTESFQSPYLIDVDGPVYQIVPIPEIKIAVMITGEKRVVAKCSYTELKQIALSGVSEAKLNLCEIRHLVDCHLIAAKMFPKIGRDGKAFLLAADPDSVSVSEWSEPDRCFTLKKKIKTSKACRCINFSAQSAILGCEKLIEVDLNNLKVEAFLNANDPSLEPYIFKRNNSGFFPIAILNLSRRCSNSSEYLICYEEVGIFVDCYGTKTRSEDIKWKQQIFSLAYKEPFLFIVYFNKVEIVHLKDSSYTREKNEIETSSDVLSLDDTNVLLPDSFDVPLINPSLLGTREEHQILYVLCQSTDGQKIVEVSGVELYGVRRRLSNSSQDSLPSTSTEDPTGNRPPLYLVDGLSDVADSDSLIASLDSAFEAIDSTTDSQSDANGSFKRPSSGSTRYDKKRVKFRE